MLAKKYMDLTLNGKDLEIIFVSSDRDEDSAASYFAEMPWTMLKYSEREMKAKLSAIFEVSGIPTLVLIDNQGVITTDGRTAIMECEFEGIRSYEEAKVAAAEKLAAEIAGYPQEVKHECHVHPLKKMPQVYSGSFGCDVCGSGGTGWVYHCDECGFDAHPKCVHTP